MPNILIIDDQPQIRRLLRIMLTREGYGVEEASNGKEGLRLFQKSPADLIITDLIMPEKEGLEVISELRTQSSQLKIIAISGGGRIGPGSYLELAEKLGAQRTFSKPFELSGLLQAVEELVGKGTKK